jgi:hypothetical protein
MKNKKTLLVLAVAGIMGVGAGVALTGSASAQDFQHRCTRDGCWTVACSDNGRCRRVWDNDRSYRRHYSTTSYDVDRANGHYDGNRWVEHNQNHRRSWMCDEYGYNCHWVYQSY